MGQYTEGLPSAPKISRALWPDLHPQFTHLHNLRTGSRWCGLLSRIWKLRPTESWFISWTYTKSTEVGRDLGGVMWSAEGHLNETPQDEALKLPGIRLSTPCLVMGGPALAVWPRRHHAKGNT